MSHEQLFRIWVARIVPLIKEALPESHRSRIKFRRYPVLQTSRPNKLQARAIELAAALVEALDKQPGMLYVKFSYKIHGGNEDSMEIFLLVAELPVQRDESPPRHK